MSAEIIVRLKIQGMDLDPDAITEKLSLSPDESWRVGDLRGKSLIKETRNGWVLGSGVASEISLNSQARALFSRLGSLACTILAGTKENMDIELSFVVYDSSMPSLYLDPDVVTLAASIGASIDFDVYVTED